MPFAARRVIVADRQKACIFTLRARIWLLADRVIARDLAKLIVQVVDHLVVTERLIFWNERMQITKFWPRDRNHLNGRVQLHGA